jgi:hypothetical protein
VCFQYQALLQKRTDVSLNTEVQVTAGELWEFYNDPLETLNFIFYQVLKSKVRRQNQFGTGSSRRRTGGAGLGTPLFTFPQNPVAEFGQEKPPPQLPSPNTTAPPHTSPAPAPMIAPAQAYMPSTAPVRRRPRAGMPQVQQVSQQLLLEEQDQGVEHAQKRLSSARGIESEIEKISEVFQKFSALVVEQGESLRLIDNDVEAAALEVEEGHRHINKTYSVTKGNRGVIIKIFGTILVLAVILVTT